MTRGRGFGMRGSYRGSGSTWVGGGGGGRSRGGFSGPSRGRYNWYKDSAGFDGRNRYASGNERYGSRGGRGGEDSSFRRYRQDSGGYPIREHNHHRSPSDSPRKRMRTGYDQASSSRRSHEGSYGDYNRYSYQEDKGYGEERKAYRDDRRGYRDHSGHGDRNAFSRDDYSHRKDPLDSDRVQAEVIMSPRRSSPRSSFRGRVSDRGRIRRVIRGTSRMVLVRRADGILVKKRIMDSFAVRKKILSNKQDYLRRLRLQKLRRIREATAAGKKEPGKEPKDEDMEESGGEEKEDWDKELEEKEIEEKDRSGKVEEKKIKKEKPKDDKEKEDGEEAADGNLAEDEEKDEDENEKIEDKTGEKVKIKVESEGRAGSEGPKTSHFGGRRFIRLRCPHCRITYPTFKEYAIHLFGSKHNSSMRRLALKHKQSLTRMRTKQRQMQKEMEEGEESLQMRANFCNICKLNYRQPRTTHIASDMHMLMKKFLLPFCKICRYAFKAPMLYENHIASLDHIKRRARQEERFMEKDENEEGSDEGKEVNMENFMTLDSVGDVDGLSKSEDDDTDSAKGEQKEGEAEKTKRTEVQLGADYVKKVEVYFCELCRRYLPLRDQPPEKVLSIHCRTRFHLQRYVRHKDDRALRREAERIHRKEVQEKEEKELKEKEKQEGEKDNENKESEKTEGDVPVKTEGAAEEGEHDVSMDGEHDESGGVDDKIWADVDKDLGELLREVEPTDGNKSSDEDEDSRAEGGRYDRFRAAKEEGDVVMEEGGEDVEPEVDEAAVVKTTEEVEAEAD